MSANKKEEKFPVCRRTLRRFRVRLVRGQRPAAGPEAACRCLNCGTVFTGNYCPLCGQHRKTERYHFTSVLRNFASGFFNIDQGFGRTLLELLYRPGYFIDDYLRGKRATYFRPFQLLFVLAALYLMTVQLVDPSSLQRQESPMTGQDSIEWKTMRKNLQEELDKAETDTERKLLQHTLSVIDRKVEAEEANDSTTLRKKATVSSSAFWLQKCRDYCQHSPYLTRVWNLLESWVKGNKAFSILLTVPLFALASWCVFRGRSIRRRYNLTEHVFIQIFMACQVLLLSILAVPINGKAEVDDLYDLPTFCIFLLFCYNNWQLYRIGCWRSCGYTLLMFTCSLVWFLLLALPVAAAIALMVI
ncbi:MAG: DUF3667 domain-containing protein [Bacteroidales bacterium]|nr:DUF3667 domain-containing protein [Bacteroidales bacterium]